MMVWRYPKTDKLRGKDDAIMSGSDNEHQGEIKCENPQDDTKYIVFKEELFKSLCQHASNKQRQVTQICFPSYFYIF